MFPFRSCITHWSPRKRRAQRTRHFQGNKNCFISEQQYAARIPKLFNCSIFQSQIWLKFLCKTTLESLFFNAITVFPQYMLFSTCSPYKRRMMKNLWGEISQWAHTVFNLSSIEMPISYLTEHLFTQTWQPGRHLGWDARKKLRLINCISFSDCSVFLPCWILRGQQWFLWLTVPHHDFKGKAAG